MSRLPKRGLDYFSIDCNPDPKLEYIEAVHGLFGFAVIVKLWRDIYKDEGYFIKWDKRAKFLFCKNNQVEIETIEAVLETCFDENIFNREKFDNFSILTSKGIQKRYIKVCKDSKRKGTFLEGKYVIDGLITELTSINPELIIKNLEEIPQSKVEESKVEESKVENGVDFEKMGFLGKAKLIWQRKFEKYVWSFEDDNASHRLEHKIKDFIGKEKKILGYTETHAAKNEIIAIFEHLINNPPEFWSDKMSLSIVDKKFNDFITNINNPKPVQNGKNIFSAHEKAWREWKES